MRQSELAVGPEFKGFLAENKLAPKTLEKGWSLNSAFFVGNLSRPTLLTKWDGSEIAISQLAQFLLLNSDWSRVPCLAKSK